MRIAREEFCAVHSWRKLILELLISTFWILVSLMLLWVLNRINLCCGCWNSPVVIQCSFLILLTNEAYTVRWFGESWRWQFWPNIEFTTMFLKFSLYFSLQPIEDGRGARHWRHEGVVRFGQPRATHRRAECGCSDNIVQFCWWIGSWRSWYVQIVLFISLVEWISLISAA